MDEKSKQHDTYEAQNGMRLLYARLFAQLQNYSWYSYTVHMSELNEWVSTLTSFFAQTSLKHLISHEEVMKVASKL